jgi:hypothetical protein
MPQTKRVAGNNVQPSPYALARVEKTDPPDGGTGKWYRYILENGRSTITGLRCGSVREVTDYATQYAEQLNVRSLNGQSAWAPRGRKPAAKPAA